MIRINNITFFSNLFRLLLICLLGTMTICTRLYGQEKPPRPITIKAKPAGALQFGAFTQGSMGGSVIISPQGNRSKSGDVILLSLGYSYSPAIIQVQALPGTVVSIATGQTGTISNGGYNLSLQVGGTYPPSPFIVTTDITNWMDIQVGGTLVVGTPGANPPGSYNGTFNVTLIQE